MGRAYLLTEFLFGEGGSIVLSHAGCFIVCCHSWIWWSSGRNSHNCTHETADIHCAYMLRGSLEHADPGYYSSLLFMMQEALVDSRVFNPFYSSKHLFRAHCCRHHNVDMVLSWFVFHLLSTYSSPCDNPSYKSVFPLVEEAQLFQVPSRFYPKSTEHDTFYYAMNCQRPVN